MLKADPGALVTYWTREAGAAALLKAVRTLAGKSCPDLTTAEAALCRAAVECGVTLTAHSVATGPAATADEKLDEYLGSLRRTGVLREYRRSMIMAALHTVNHNKLSLTRYRLLRQIKSRLE